MVSSMQDCRNQLRWHDKRILWQAAIDLIAANVSLSGNMTKKLSYNSIFEFPILKSFNIRIHPPKPPDIREVIWHPSTPNWIKCNTDGEAAGTPSEAACGGLFRNQEALYIGCFAHNLGTGTSLFVELSGAMQAIEIAHNKALSQLWLETNSMLVIQAFNSISIVPWRVRNRWDNCMLLAGNMNLLVTHIFRERNCCADKL